MRQVLSDPFVDGDGAVVFAVHGWGPLRLRSVGIVRGDVRRGPRLVTRGPLLRFAGAVEDGAFPARLPGTGATVEQDPAGAPYGVLTWPGGSARVWLGPLAQAARSAARA